MLYAGKTVTIMPLGDSITYGNSYGNDPIDMQGEFASYRKLLWEDLGASGYTVDFIGSENSGGDLLPAFDTDHQGHWGDTALEIADDVYDNLSNNEPDVVLLHIGTNELRTDTTDVEQVLNEIDKYEDEKNVHIKVILARIINRWIEWTDDNGDTRSNEQDRRNTTLFNNNLQTMADARIFAGDDIIVVDMETDSGINYDSRDMADDLHPNDSGYAKIANIWLGALQTTLPTHLWSFDEPDNSTTFIDTYRDNDGECMGDCPQATLGIVAGAQIFQGSEEVDVPDDDTFDWRGSDSFTIEFWIKPTRTDGDNQVIVSRENEANNNHYWWAGIDGSSGRVTFRLRDSKGAPVNLDGPVLNVGEWYHIACVRDGANNQNFIYVNEGNVSTPATYTGNFAGTTPVNVGYYYTNSFHLDSAVDELTIYNGAMNTAQAAQIYERGIAPPTAYAGEDETVEVNQPVTITGSGTDGTIASYEWKKGTTVLATTASFDYTPDTVGTDTLTLTVTNTASSTDEDSMTVTVTLPSWITKTDTDNGNTVTYTVAGNDSAVELDSSIEGDLDITAVDGGIIFEDTGSDPKVFIRLMSNGEVITGYTEGNDENPTINSGFAPGTKVSVDADMVLLIETELTADLTFGDK